MERPARTLADGGSRDAAELITADGRAPTLASRTGPLALRHASRPSPPLRATLAFPPLALAYTVNELGNWLGEIALAVLVFDQTGSPLATAALFIGMQFLPAVVCPGRRRPSRGDGQQGGAAARVRGRGRDLPRARGADGGQLPAPCRGRAGRVDGTLALAAGRSRARRRGGADPSGQLRKATPSSTSASPPPARSARCGRAGGRGHRRPARRCCSMRPRSRWSRCSCMRPGRCRA